MLPPLAKSIIVVQALLTSTIIMGGFASYLLSFAWTGKLQHPQLLHCYTTSSNIFKCISLCNRVGSDAIIHSHLMCVYSVQLYHSTFKSSVFSKRGRSWG